MTGFIIGAVALVAITLLLLLLPLRRPIASHTDQAAVSRLQLNSAIYRDALAELKSECDDGSLAAADFEQAQNELQRRLLEDTEPGENTVPNNVAGSGKGVFLALGLGLPVLAAALYLMLGNPAAIDPPPPEQRFSADDIDRMVSGLAAKLEQEPDNLEGWVMLARSYQALGRSDEAVRAYERAKPLVENNADLLVDQAGALASQRRAFDGDVAALVARALKLEPNHPQALWLHGTIAYDAGDYAQTLADWETLLKLLPPDSENVATLQKNLADVRARQAQAATVKKP